VGSNRRLTGVARRQTEAGASGARLGVGPAAITLGLALLCSGCAQSGATVQGQKVHGLYVVIALMAAPVFFAVEGVLIWSVIRFRKRAGDPALGPQTSGSTRALVVFFVIPAVIVAALFGFGEQTLASVIKQDPNPAVRIRAEGFQWEWTFYYLNEGFFVSGKTKAVDHPEKPALMVLPVGEPVRVELHSRDVIHSFFVPGFLFKKDVIPGRENAFTVTPNTLGTFKAQCAEFCGLWHSHMTFVVEVVTAADYAAWAEQQIKAIQSITCKPPAGPPAIVAKDISWNTNCLALPLGPPPAITVDNQDAGIDHNFAIYDSFSQAKEFFQTGRFSGVATKSFQLPPLPPGRYYFQCDVHGPSMSGVLIVGGGK
jgi:cytochrome c oxidase subunit 2